MGTLALASSQGFTYCSASTDVAVTNMCELVERLDIAMARAAVRYDELSGYSLVADTDTNNFPVNDVGRRRKLIIRGLSIHSELRTINLLLENPVLGDNEVDILKSIHQHEWHLAQTVTFWFLLALGHTRVIGREVEPSDPVKIHTFRNFLDGIPELSLLRELASGRLGWSEYLSQGMISDKLLGFILAKLVESADLLFTTPAVSSGEDFGLARTRAKAIVFDDAAAMHRADAYCVHGNTLLPCLLAGDGKQLGPHLAAGRLKDTNEHALNRHYEDGGLSLLEFYQGHGFPVFRLNQQLRMANGIFDPAARLFYPDLAFSYGEQSDINLPKHKPGRLLEQFSQERFPGLRPPPAGKLQPIFLHYKGTTTRNALTGSKRNVEQSLYALKFLIDFIAATELDASNIVILTPYTYNLEFINSQLKRPEFISLNGAVETSTVDSFQGRESALVVYITVSTLNTGPGFLSDERRLNVAITRQISGLIIVGDINVTGKIADKNGNFLAGSRGNRRPTASEAKSVRTQQPNGHFVFKKCLRLRQLITTMVESGRVAMPEAGY